MAIGSPTLARMFVATMTAAAAIAMAQGDQRGAQGQHLGEGLSQAGHQRGQAPDPHPEADDCPAASPIGRLADLGSRESGGEAERAGQDAELGIAEVELGLDAGRDRRQHGLVDSV